MKIIEAKAEIIRPDLSNPGSINAIYRLIEEAGRTCYKSKDKEVERLEKEIETVAKTDMLSKEEKKAEIYRLEELLLEAKNKSARRFVSSLVKSGHEAMIEHANMCVRFTVDRGVSHELVRHRLASWAQESSRYCVAGDTKLTFSNPHLRLSIEELYNNVANSSNGAWKRMRIRQYNEQTGELEMSYIKNVFFNGVKECVRIKTKLGYELVCTPDHTICTPDGYKNAADLTSGNKIYVNGTEALYMNYAWLYDQSITKNKTFVQIANEFGFNVSTIKKWARKLCIPKKGTGYFNVGHVPWNKGITDERQADALRKYHHCGRRKDKILKIDTKKYFKYTGKECSICGTKSSLEVHHIDKNRDNNYPDNLITVCESCHQRIHSQNLKVAYADEIISIESAGEQKVYDLEMCGYSNYVANGIVVHNCNYSKDKFGDEITVIDPIFYKDIPAERKLEIQNMFTKEFKHPGNLVDTLSDLEKRYADWFYSCYVAEASYLEMLHYGAEPQEARDVLPTSTKTEVVMTTNIREWRHFFKLRAAGTTGKPHPQMVEVALPLLKKCQQIMPELFGDIEIPG